MRPRHRPNSWCNNIKRYISPTTTNIILLVIASVGTFIVLTTNKLDEAYRSGMVKYRSPHRHNDFSSIVQRKSSFTEASIRLVALRKNITLKKKRLQLRAESIVAVASRSGDYNQTLVNWVDQWKRGNTSPNKLLIYSAYWDDRSGRSVRVIGVTLTRKSPELECILSYRGGKMVTVDAQKKVMKEHWNLKYSAYIFTCVSGTTKETPLTVAIGEKKRMENAAVIPIHLNKEDTVSPRGNIAVCVKPFHYSYDRAVWLVEFIELNKLLGVDHFYFYNHTVGRDVDSVLEHYIEEGKVTVLPWVLDLKSQKEIRTEGIFASLNDCLFRTMFLFKYVINIDFDEYIIPRKHMNYTSLLRDLEKKEKIRKGVAGSFVFRNVFFYLYWENDTEVYGYPPEVAPQNYPYLLTQYKTKRLTTPMKYGSRSKYIVVPERALEAGNHVIWKHVPSAYPILVHEKMALLHHYRICEFGGFECMKKPFVVDKTAQKHKDALLTNVRQQCYRTFGGDCPKSPPLGSPW